MTGRGAWTGAVAGLVVGAALGLTLLTLRGGGITWSWPGSNEQGQVLTGSPAAVDTVATAPPVAGGQSTRPMVESGPQDRTHVGEVLRGERSNAIVQATRQVAPAVVSINVLQQQAVRDASMDLFEALGLIPRRELIREVQSMGSGVIVSSDGLVVTNKHVVSSAVQIIVTLSDGRNYQAQLLETVDRFDLALLKIEAQGLPTATLAHEDDLEIGEWAIAIGSPYGYLLADTQPTVTVGVISALNRDIKRIENQQPYLGMIQTDAAINPGNSGGPLVNTSGEVVGINTFIFSESRGSVGIGFAVPASRVQNVISEVLQYGHFREANLGLTVLRLTPSIMQSLRLTDPKGALVQAVQTDSPAGKAGIRPYDILREINGLPLENLDTIYRLFYDSNVGDKLTFKAERAGEYYEGELTLEETSD